MEDKKVKIKYVRMPEKRYRQLQRRESQLFRAKLLVKEAWCVLSPIKKGTDK
jgi:hypothetical protein